MYFLVVREHVEQSKTCYQRTFGRLVNREDIQAFKHIISDIHWALGYSMTPYKYKGKKKCHSILVCSFFRPSFSASF